MGRLRKIACLLPCVLILCAFQDKPLNKTGKLKEAQIKFMQGDRFAQKGITGRGIRIAVLDGGFPGTNTHPALKHLIDRKQIIATWNFVKNKEDVFNGVAHGTEVLSCIAGIDEGAPLGLAPDAEFLLALTEEMGEPLKEEENWVKAVDWAIEHGANIIQSSLGYTYQRYFTTDLDGKQSLCAQAAARAARKGVLIINCMGNEGMSKWKTMVTPADADSILSVGAIDPLTGLVAGFSSIGPTADNRIKPNVCAPGIVVTVNPSGGIHEMSGTSFAAPLITGFAACTWQLNPTLSAQDILRLVEKAGHLYPYYDYSHGFGVPLASAILGSTENKLGTQIIITADDTHFLTDISAKESTKSPVLPENYLFYQISDPNGYLVRYGVYRVTGPEPLKISKSGYKPGYIYRCNFNGETASWQETR